MDLEKIAAYNAEQKKKADENSAVELQKDNAGLVAKAVTGSAGVVAGTVRDAAQKTEKATQEVSKSVESTGKEIIDAVTNSQNEVATALNNLVVATVVSKDPQLLQAAKDIANLLSAISQAGSDFKGSKLNDLPKTLDFLAASIQSLVDSETSDTQTDYTDILTEIKTLLAKDDKESVINVSAPNVTVDTSKIEKAIKSLEKVLQSEDSGKIDLEDYKAQDLADGDTFQYVGFVAQDGSWYMIENDIEGNSLRYAFGMSNYAQNWAKYNSQKYKLLDEAIREIQA